MFYIIIMLLAFILSIPLNSRSSNLKRKIINNIFFLLSFLVALLPHALRYSIGTDYFYTYVPYFFFIGEGVKEFSEIGFNLLNKIVYVLTGNYKILFFICSFIFLYFIYSGIKSNSKNISLSILLIFLLQSYFYSMNMVRQSIAISLVFWSFKYIKENKTIKYILICLVASSIHSSALLAIPLIFLSNMNISNRIKIIFLIVCFLLGKIIGNIASTLILLYTKYGWYYSSAYNTGNVSTILIVVNIIIFILSYLYSPKEKNKEYLQLSNINFIVMCLLIISSQIPLINRIVRYFTIFQLLFLPMIFLQLKGKKEGIFIKSGLIIFLFFTMFYQIIILGGEGVYPYISIFD